jgi:methionine synthase II (cobalamin-independent)
MDETRFTRLEKRVDEIKDDLSEVKADVKITTHTIDDLKTSFRDYTETVKKHVNGDEKIITEIQPIIEQFKFEQELKRRRHESLKKWGMKLGIPATILALISAAITLFSFS